MAVLLRSVFFVARLGKQVERRLPVASAVGWGRLIAASVILADWNRRSGSFAPGERHSAAQASADVAGGQVHAVAESLGRLAVDPAVASFLRGFEIALLVAGAITAAAGLLGFLGLRHLRSLTRQQRPTTDVTMAGKGDG